MLTTYPKDRGFVLPKVCWEAMKHDLADEAAWIADATEGRIDLRSESLPDPAPANETILLPALDALAVMVNDERRRVEIAGARPRINTALKELAGMAPDSLDVGDGLLAAIEWLPDAERKLRLAQRLFNAGQRRAARYLAEAIAEQDIDPEHRAAARAKVEAWTR